MDTWNRYEKENGSVGKRHGQEKGCQESLLKGNEFKESLRKRKGCRERLQKGKWIWGIVTGRKMDSGNRQGKGNGCRKSSRGGK